MTMCKRRERGTGLVEFALVVVLLLPLLLAIVEFGRAWFTVQVIHNAAREGARVCATTMGEPEDRIQAARSRVDVMLTDVGFADFEIDFPDPELPGTWGFGRPLKVVVRQPFVSIAGSFVPALEGEIELKGSAVFNQEMP